MALKYTPLPGTILRCDFHGFKAPEMTKHRPVIVLSPKLQNIFPSTLLVVPLSTTEPEIILKHHLQISLPGAFLPAGLLRNAWVKGDMICSVSLNRLSLYHFPRGENGKRQYYTDRYSGENLFNIRKAAAHALGIHLPNLTVV